MNVIELKEALSSINICDSTKAFPKELRKWVRILNRARKKAESEHKFKYSNEATL